MLRNLSRESGFRIGSETLNPKKMENQEIVNRLDLVQSREREAQIGYIWYILYENSMREPRENFRKNWVHLNMICNQSQLVTIEL